MTLKPTVQKHCMGPLETSKVKPCARRPQLSTKTASVARISNRNVLVVVERRQMMKQIAMVPAASSRRELLRCESERLVHPKDDRWVANTQHNQFITSADQSCLDSVHFTHTDCPLQLKTPKLNS